MQVSYVFMQSENERSENVLNGIENCIDMRLEYGSGWSVVVTDVVAAGTQKYNCPSLLRTKATFTLLHFQVYPF